MPEETDLMLDDRENADSTECEAKQKHSIAVSSKTPELKSSANDIKVPLKSKKTSNKTKKDIKQRDIISSRDNCAKDAKDVRNNKQKNGYIKSVNTDDNTQHNADNERQVIIEDEVETVDATIVAIPVKTVELINHVSPVSPIGRVNEGQTNDTDLDQQEEGQRQDIGSKPKDEGLIYLQTKLD